MGFCLLNRNLRTLLVQLNADQTKHRAGRTVQRTRAEGMKCGQDPQLLGFYGCDDSILLVAKIGRIPENGHHVIARGLVVADDGGIEYRKDFMYKSIHHRLLPAKWSCAHS